MAAGWRPLGEDIKKTDGEESSNT